MELTILRSYLPQGTNGRLYINRAFQCYTIELPWLQNKPCVSCIPEGSYLLQRRYSPKYGSHLLVTNVPGRALILMHPANNALTELKGCIAPVSTLLAPPGQGTASRRALASITALVFPVMGKELITLTIKKDENEYKD